MRRTGVKGRGDRTTLVGLWLLCAAQRSVQASQPAGCSGDDGGLVAAGKLLQLADLQRGANDALQHVLRILLKGALVGGVRLDVHADGGARRAGAAAGRGREGGGAGNVGC